MVEATRENFTALGQDDVFGKTSLTADSGFHTSANIETLFEQKVDAYIADNKFRKRDPRFAEQGRYKERHRAEIRKSRHSIDRPADFMYDKQSRTCVCAAGKALYQNGGNCTIKGAQYVKFSAPRCIACPVRSAGNACGILSERPSGKWCSSRAGRVARSKPTRGR